MGMKQGIFMGLSKQSLPWLLTAFLSGYSGFCCRVLAASDATPVQTPAAKAASPVSTLTPKRSSAAETKGTVPGKPEPEVENKEPAATPESGEKDQEADEADAAEKPFAPHWTGEFGLTYSTQPDSQGQAQVTNELSMTGTYNLLENSTYVSLELTAGQQTLEGSPTNYGTLTAEGALGMGFFQPSLSFAQQRGAAALNSTTATLDLNFQLLDALTVGPLGGAGLESHQGPVSTFSPLSARGDAFEEGDSYNWNWGGQATFEASDLFSTSLTFEDEYDDTYQFQDILHTVTIGLKNQYDRIVSLTLATDFTFWKDVSLDLSVEEGKEYEPAGVFYSPVKHRTLFNANPVEQDFEAYVLGITYSIE